MTAITLNGMTTTMKQQCEQNPDIAWAVNPTNTAGMSGGHLALAAIVKALINHFDNLDTKYKQAITAILTTQASLTTREQTIETRVANDPVLPTIYPFDPDPQVPGEPGLEEVLRTLVDHFDRMDGKLQTAVASAVQSQTA